MSDNKPSNSENEEVDLGQLFNAIGRLFEKLFSYVGLFFITLFKILIYSLKPLVNNFKVIAIVVFCSAIVGYIADKFRRPVYQSDMLVRPYFESKYQLANNVKYFNALISDGNWSKISNIFEIDTTEAQTLIGFDIAVGPETANDLLVEYDNYIKSIDSTLASEVSYDQFIENRDILNANVFSVTAFARKNDVFLGLERGFGKTFENDYSKRLREKRDDTIRLRKLSLEKQLNEIKALQTIYVKVIENEVENPQINLVSEGMIPLQQTKRETKEFDLLDRELKIRALINKLDERLVREDTYFDVLAGFEEVGSRSVSLRNNYLLVFPALTFGVMVLSYIFIRCFMFIKEYGEE